MSIASTKRPSPITPAVRAAVPSARRRPAGYGSKRSSATCVNTNYFHVVFTLPHELNPLALTTPSAFFDLLFEASSQTLLEVAADPRRLGAEIGFLSILHTWSSNLLPHYHVHCVVPAGGLSADHQTVDPHQASAVPAAHPRPAHRVPPEVPRRTPAASIARVGSTAAVRPPISAIQHGSTN